jgi:hypothetical protein
MESDCDKEEMQRDGQISNTKREKQTGENYINRGRNIEVEGKKSMKYYNATYT